MPVLCMKALPAESHPQSGSPCAPATSLVMYGSEVKVAELAVNWYGTKSTYIPYLAASVNIVWKYARVLTVDGVAPGVSDGGETVSCQYHSGK